MAVGSAIPFSPFGRGPRDGAAALAFFPWLVATLLAYCVLTQMVKTLVHPSLPGVAVGKKRPRMRFDPAPQDRSGRWMRRLAVGFLIGSLLLFLGIGLMVLWRFLAGLLR